MDEQRFCIGVLMKKKPPHDHQKRARQTAKRKKARKSANKSGLTLEKAVARIQQMMDPNSTVTHNERLIDRVGNHRQYDVVVRGNFGGNPVLGVIECKDHKRRKGPSDVEAFAKKTENLGANLRILVSSKGFTEQALKLAKHEFIGCMSLLPTDPRVSGFSIGSFWYGTIKKWTDVRLTLHFAEAQSVFRVFVAESVKWNGKSVTNWFIRELITKNLGDKAPGDYTLTRDFREPVSIEVEGSMHLLKGISCTGRWVSLNKRKWVSWTGDAFYDWHLSSILVPARETIVSSGVETDLSFWDDYDGPIPIAQTSGPVRLTMIDSMKWDESKEVAEIGEL
jgi:Restriction endonuclease